MKTWNWRQWAVLIGFVFVLLLGVILQNESFWLRVLTFAMLMSAVAQSWNLLAGYTGQWSLAQLAFFGIGAYIAGILEFTLGIPLLVGLIPAAILTAAFAAGIGYVTLRLRGHYFAVVTFFMLVALFELVRYFADYTGGQYGLNVPFERGNNLLMFQFEERIAYYYVAVGVMVIGTGILWALVRSPIGLMLRAIRDDQDSAAALGVRTLGLKVLAMSVSAVMASIAGVVYLGTYKLVDAETAFGIHNSLDPVVAGILGGAGALLGGVVGEFTLQPVIAQVNVVFGSLPGIASLIYGAILMLVILLIPKGLLGIRVRRDTVRKLTRFEKRRDAVGVKVSKSNGEQAEEQR
jgi:branched-chain amino acid transport system permease protein